MAELAAQGNLHEVDDAEADQAYEDIKHMIPHNVMIGNLLSQHLPTFAGFGERKQIVEKRSCSVEDQR